MSSFWERFKTLRKERGYTQEKAADIFGTTKSSISRYEKNINIPKTPKLERIAEHFNVSIDYLLGKSKIRRKDPNWFEKLPPDLQELALEHNIDYLEVALEAKDKGWTPEAIREAMNLIEKYSPNNDNTG